MVLIYLKKAIMETDEDWSTKKKWVISVQIRKSVSSDLPYFTVNFGLQGRFSHVIKDQHKFPTLEKKASVGC
jgi:hypothetical protein